MKIAVSRGYKRKTKGFCTSGKLEEHPDLIGE